MRTKTVGRGKESDVSEEHRRGDVVCREGGKLVSVMGQNHREPSAKDMGKCQVVIFFCQIAFCVSLIRQGPDIGAFDNVVARNT